MGKSKQFDPLKSANLYHKVSSHSPQPSLQDLASVLSQLDTSVWSRPRQQAMELSEKLELKMSLAVIRAKMQKMKSQRLSLQDAEPIRSESLTHIMELASSSRESREIYQDQRAFDEEDKRNLHSDLDRILKLLERQKKQRFVGQDAEIKQA